MSESNFKKGDAIRVLPFPGIEFVFLEYLNGTSVKVQRELDGRIFTADETDLKPISDVVDDLGWLDDTFDLEAPPGDEITIKLGCTHEQSDTAIQIPEEGFKHCYVCKHCGIVMKVL